MRNVPVLLANWLRGFVITACLLLIADPLQAEGTPTPLPPAGWEAGLVREVNNLGSTIGTNNLLLLFILVLVGVVVVVVVRPYATSTTAANRSTAEANQAVITTTTKFISLAEDGYKVIGHNTQVQAGVQSAIAEFTNTALIVNKTMQTVLDRLAQERAEGVKQVNEHTTEAHEETRRVIVELEGRVDQALGKLDEVIASVEKRFTYYDDTIKIKLDNLQRELSSIKESIQTVKADSSRELPTLPDAPADPTPTPPEPPP